MVNVKAAFTYQNISQKIDVSSRLSSNNEDKKPEARWCMGQII